MRNRIPKDLWPLYKEVERDMPSRLPWMIEEVAYRAIFNSCHRVNGQCYVPGSLKVRQFELPKEIYNPACKNYQIEFLTFRIKGGSDYRYVEADTELHYKQFKLDSREQQLFAFEHDTKETATHE